MTVVINAESGIKSFEYAGIFPTSATILDIYLICGYLHTRHSVPDTLSPIRANHVTSMSVCDYS